MLASSEIATGLSSLMSGYSLCAQTEGKSKNTIAIVANSVRYLNSFLISEGLSNDVTRIGTREIRAFIFHLQQKRCFSNHPYSKVQRRGFSGHTINTYMRSIRAFWSWLVEEEIIEVNPFSRLKIPKPPKKVIATFSQYQIESLLIIMNNSPEGYRDMIIILTLLDTGLRVNELINLKMDNVWLEEGLIKVLGKGNKERLEMNMRALKGEEMTGTDAEACVYLYTAALTNPMDHDWTQIYLYIAGKTYTRWKKNEMPEDIRVESLRDDQMVDLNRLKAWLYHKRTTVRLDRERAERRHKKEEEAAQRKAEQPALFDF